jgi:hypothetical protein
VSVRDCSRFRPWLGARAAAASASPAVPPQVPAGLDVDRHLAACRACRTEAEELALLSFAIRRAWQGAADLEPPADAWPRLRERVSRPRPTGRLVWATTSMAGVAMGTALAIGLIAPLGMAMPFADHGRAVVGEAGVDGAPPPIAPNPDDDFERQWLRLQLAERTRLADLTRPIAPVLAGAGAPRGPLTPRREQMRYAEDPPPPHAAGPSSIPPMRAL